uniref:EOG090X0EO1 n=1 Tax=Ceriodaphnia reticulata TaxID=302197 RepID=A0A4Y7LY52_9CRUS|nr:EOG090X0EO1 [Ceriodaphnia reticulata]SVE73224.1 EOG090X0EO1 [Ceriodaphnia reticulata]
MKVQTAEIESLKNDILKGNLTIQNVLQKIQQPDITESDMLLLNSEYRGEFKHLKQLIDEFERVAKEEDEDGELFEDVNLFKSQLISLQASFRKANVQSQLTVNMKSKAELFYSNPAEMEVRSRQNKSKEELIKMSTNVTGNLRNICQSMASVLEQNRGTLEILAQSSQTVTDTQDEFKVMGSALTTTKKLVSRFGRRETTDLILIILALAAFFAACVYVIQKRMF